MSIKKKPAIKKRQGFNLVRVLKDFENGTFTLEETAEKIDKHDQALRNEVIKMIAEYNDISDEWDTAKIMDSHVQKLRKLLGKFLERSIDDNKDTGNG